MATESNREQTEIKNQQFWEGKLSEAEGLIENDKDDPNGYHHKGSALLKLHRNEEAIVAFDKNIEINNQSASAYALRGEAKRWCGMHKDAIDDLTKSININKENKDDKYASPYIHRGWCHFKLGSFADAEADFNSAKDINPEDTRVQDGIDAIADAVSEKKASQKFYAGNYKVLKRKYIVYSVAAIVMNGSIIALLGSMAYFVKWYFCEFLYLNLFEFAQDGANGNASDFSYNNFFIVSALVLILFTFAWVIRIAIDVRDKYEILREDYYRRAMADATITQVFGEEMKEGERQERMKYINKWMDSSAAELILQYRSKGGGREQPAVEIIANKTNSVGGSEQGG